MESSREDAEGDTESAFRRSAQTRLPSRRTSWHPQFTGYRALVILLTVGFGSLKAISSYTNLTIVSTAVEWIFGVVVYIGLFWLGLYETTHPSAIPWLFERDYTHSVRRFVNPPAVVTNRGGTIKYNVAESHQNRRATLTAYRILVSVLVASLGLTKASLAYQGYSAVPTTLDWISGTLLAVGLYWLGLYESSPDNPLPLLFTADYQPAIVIGVSLIGRLLLLSLLSSWGYFWYWIWTHWGAGLLGFEPPTFSSPTLNTLYELSFPFSWIPFVGIAELFAVVPGILSLVSTIKLISTPARSVPTYVVGRASLPGASNGFWASLPLPSRARLEYASRWLVPCMHIAGHVFIHLILMGLSLTWEMFALFVFLSMWASPHTGFFSLVGAVLVSIVPFGWILLGLPLCLSVLVSFIAPLLGSKPHWEFRRSLTSLWIFVSRFGTDNPGGRSDRLA
ncbi:hypothetical protein JAAARDRAFT_154948 [Jaapia argillacea MUCL 33604]|uniref:Uncharacterized protein n=1 Tax=Jaapia argillacea MUCL 33604 TaxID=933084 RepID=A0A067PUT0_9AGAM|nr:hypothetical protein JAAARDRAFT_154948 [Jaapia argillacea MUCL 33604]